MNIKNNRALSALAQTWKLDGDWMQCRACRKALVASRDGEALRHNRDCPNQEHEHPWKALRAAIADNEATA